MAGGRDIPRCVIQSLVLADLDVYRVTIEGPQGQSEARLVAGHELAELEAHPWPKSAG